MGRVSQHQIQCSSLSPWKLFAESNVGIWATGQNRKFPLLVLSATTGLHGKYAYSKWYECLRVNSRHNQAYREISEYSSRGGTKPTLGIVPLSQVVMYTVKTDIL